MVADKMVRAEPRMLPVRICRMNCGTSISVGHAFTQGASWQNRQREASSSACAGVSGGLRSAKFFSSCSGDSLGAGSLNISLSRGGFYAPETTLSRGGGQAWKLCECSIECLLNILDLGERLDVL